MKYTLLRTTSMKLVLLILDNCQGVNVKPLLMPLDHVHTYVFLIFKKVLGLSCIRHFSASRLIMDLGVGYSRSCCVYFH